MKDIADLIGRIFISMIFVYEAFDTIVYFKSNIKTMREYGINWQPEFLLYITVAFLIVGAILVLIGYHASFGSLLLLFYYLPFTFIVYSFWNDAPGNEQRVSGLNFMRNMAVCGGLLLLAANGAGKYSIKRLIHVMRLPK
jgi:putative oxidoreductase